mmetsp:Transcript_23344/g.77536  ORF Transcript_23344/g.77536 Transcript_23344/m.77536 type:complete len:243 (+) Transcript_23344:140-868(+)
MGSLWSPEQCQAHTRLASRPAAHTWSAPSSGNWPRLRRRRRLIRRLGAELAVSQPPVHAARSDDVLLARRRRRRASRDEQRVAVVDGRLVLGGRAGGVGAVDHLWLRRLCPRRHEVGHVRLVHHAVERDQLRLSAAGRDGLKLERVGRVSAEEGGRVGAVGLPAARHKDVGGEVHAGEHERAVQKGERRVVLRVVVVEPLGLQPHRVREDDLVAVRPDAVEGEEGGGREPRADRLPVDRHRS